MGPRDRAAACSAHETNGVWIVAELAPAEAEAQAAREKDQGNECFRAREFGAAVRHYSRAIELTPDAPVLRTNRAAALLKLKQWADAEADCTAAVTIPGPHAVKAFMRRAAARQELGRAADALADLTAALALVRCRQSCSAVWIRCRTRSGLGKLAGRARITRACKLMSYFRAALARLCGRAGGAGGQTHGQAGCMAGGTQAARPSYQCAELHTAVSP